MTRGQDIVLGLLFLILGLTMAWGAGAYTGAGGTYPRTLGLCLAACGLAVAARAARSSVSLPRTLSTAPVPLLLALGCCAAYALAIVPLGFYTASAALMVVLPLALGFRRPIYLVVTSVLFITIVYLVFTIVLEKPLPAEFWSPARRTVG